MKGQHTRYSQVELDWINGYRDLTRADLHALFQQIFHRPEVTQANLTALCKRRGWLTGRTGHYAKGQTPMNKGQKMPFHPNSAATRFKPGSVPQNVKPLGAERITKDGYVEISVDQTNPHTGYARRYVQKHRWLWEQVHGPVPANHRLKCLDGDRTNTAPENWTAIPMALAPRLNGRFGRGYDAAPAEVKPTLLAIAKLEHAARERRKEGQ